MPAPEGCDINNSPFAVVGDCEKVPKMYFPSQPFISFPRYTLPPIIVVAFPPAGFFQLFTSITGSINGLPRLSTEGQEAVGSESAAALKQCLPSFTFQP